MKKPTKEEIEKRAVAAFLKNKGETADINNLIKPRDDSIIDIVDAKFKYQIRELDDELIGKVGAGRKGLADKVPSLLRPEERGGFKYGFFGSRDFNDVLNIIKMAVEAKDKKKNYSPLATQDIILLLDGLELFEMLELSQSFQISQGEDTQRLLKEVKNIGISNFKEVYLVGNKFNLKIK